jgi:hypothetical protein
MTQRGNGRGYLRVTVSCAGIIDHPYVHQMVCEAFHGPCPAGMQVRHFPLNDRSNNRAANLSWATKIVNEGDKITHDTINHGERNGQAILSEDDVKAIRSRVSAGESSAVLAEEYEVSAWTVRDAVMGRRWGYLDGALDKIPRRRNPAYHRQQAYRDRLKAAGLCIKCRKPSALHFYCEPCKIIQRDDMRSRAVRSADAGRVRGRDQGGMGVGCGRAGEGEGVNTNITEDKS